MMGRLVTHGRRVTGHRAVGVAAVIAVLLPLALSAAARAGQPTDYAGVRATLRREIPRVLRSSHAVGLSIALVDGKRTVWARGFGWADRAARRRVTARTLFHIGSTSKTLTAAAVMQLVHEGRVDLDAPLSRYVPRFRMLRRYAGNRITVRSVLDMHSGIPGDIFNGLITEGRPYPHFNSLLLKTLSKTYPERRVNTAWAYSNSGYALLQNLVQNVTGQPFARYTREHLFAPMGMDHTTFDDAAPPYRDLAHGYQAIVAANGTVRVAARPREYINGWATGSVVSSATDMAAYLKTLIAGGATPSGHRILTRSTLREMTTPQTRLPADITSFRAGLGWWVGDTGNTWMGPAIHWNGDTASFHTFFRWLPRLKVGVFVSVNTTTHAQVHDEIGLRALGLMVTAKTGRTAPKPPRPARVAKVTATTLHRATGEYASTSSGLYTVTAADGGLRAAPTPAVPGAHPVTLLPRADGWYVSRSPGGDPLSAMWIKPATVAGRHLLLAHYDRLAGPQPDGFVSVFAEKLPSTYHVPRAWRARVGSYRAINLVPDSTEVARTGTLTIVHGVLQWNRLVVAPTSGRLGFTYGLTAFLVARGAGDALIPSGNTLTILGVRYRKVKTG
jgi:CubicO group peptidase (beta-lactamase class C family)